MGFLQQQKILNIVSTSWFKTPDLLRAYKDRYSTFFIMRSGILTPFNDEKIQTKKQTVKVRLKLEKNIR